MNTKALRQKILDLAIHGKLVPQDPNDEPASVLLERIRDEKERLIKDTLTFTSVHTIPGTHASAAFTSKTSEVFKEEHNIAPVIIIKNSHKL